MSYYVYMLKSKGKKPLTYIGYTNNLKKELIYIIKEKGLNLLEEGLGDLFIENILSQKVKQFLENII